MISNRIYPDYGGGGLLNLIASCTASRGAVPSHPVLDCLKTAELSAARNVVLVLIDGLGYNYVAGQGAGSVLTKHLTARLTSVFPSTTASAITTTFTGLAPAEHGLTGWYTWFPEAGTIAAPLPFKPRGAGDSLEQRGSNPQPCIAARRFSIRCRSTRSSSPIGRSSIRTTTVIFADAPPGSPTMTSRDSSRKPRLR